MNTVILTCIITAISGVSIVVLQEILYRNLLTRQKLEHEQEVVALKEQIQQALSEKASQPRMLALQNLKSELLAARSQVITSSQDRNYERKLKNAYYEILHLHSFSGFCATMDGRLFGFVTRIRTLYPSLSEQQYMLLVLYLLDLPGDDISTIMCYQLASLPNTKMRLAHKMNLSSGLLLQPHLVELYCQKTDVETA